MEKARSRKPPRPDGGLSSMDKLDSFLKDREHLAEEEQKRRPADERSRGAYSTVSILRKKATASRTDGSGRSSRSRSQPRAGGRSYDDESSRDMDDDIDDDIYDDHPRDGSSRSSRSRKSKHKQQPLDRLDKFLAEKEDYAPRVSSDDRSRGAYSTVSRSRKTTSSSAARSKARPRLNSKDKDNNINGTAKPSLDHIREVDSVAEMSYNHSERSGVVPPPASAEPKNGGALGSYFSSEEEQYPKDGNKKRRGGKGDSRSVYTSMPSRNKRGDNEDADGVPIPKTEDELLAVLRTPARRNARRSNKDSASVAPSSSKTKDLRGSRSVAPKEEGTGRRASMSKSTREGGRVKSTHTSRSRRTSADRDDEDYHDDDNYSKAPPRSSRRQSNGVPRDDDDRSIVTRSRRRASNNADHHEDDHYSRAPRRSRGGDDDEDYYSRAAPRKGRGGGRGHDHDNDDDYSRAPPRKGGRHNSDYNNDYDDDNYSRAPRRRRDDHHDNDDDNASIVRRSRRRDEDDYSRAAPRRRRKDEENDDDNASIVRRRRRDSAHGAADHRTRRNSNATESRRRNRSPSRGRRLSGDAPTTTRPRSRSRAPRRNSTEGRGGGGGRGPPPRRPSNDDVVRGSRGRRYSNDAAADNRSRRPRSKSRGRRSAEEDVEPRPPRARSKSRGRRYSNDHPTSSRSSRPRSKSRARRPSNEDTTTSRRSRRPSNDDAPSRSRARAPEDDDDDDEQQVYDDDQDEVFEHGVRRKHYDPRDGSDSEYEKRTRRGGGHDSDSEGRHDSDEDTVRTKDTATQQPRRRSHDKPGTSARRPKTDAERQKNRKTLRSALRGEMEDLPRDEEKNKDDDDDGDLLDDMLEPVNGDEDAAVEQQQSDNIRPSPAVAAMSGADRPAKSPFQTMSLPGQTTNNGAVKKPLVSVLRQPAPPPETKEEDEEPQDETESTPIQDGHGGLEEDGMEDETPKRDNRLRTGRPHPPHAPNMLLDGGEEKASSSELNVDYSEQDIFTSYTWSLARQDPQKIQRERQILRGFIRDSPLYQAFELLELRPTENGS